MNIDGAVMGLFFGGRDYDPMFRKPRALAKRNNDISVAQISSFLDPRYKDLEVETTTVRSSVIQFIRYMCGKMAGKEMEVDQNQSVDNDFDSLINGARNKRQRNYSNELDDYISQDKISYHTDPLEWWHLNESLYPTVSKLAKRFLCIPATSAPSERVFSTGGNIVTAKRSCLHPSHVETLIFVSQNARQRKNKHGKNELKNVAKR